MANWSDIEQQSPEIAKQGRALLARHQVAYLATVRKDGGPRVHQICPAIIDGALYASIAPSAKLHDLRRDSRYMLHFMCGEQDAEFHCRGTAAEITDAAEQATIRNSATKQDLNYTEHEILFRLSIDRADTTTWDNFGTRDITPNRACWIAQS